MALFRDIKYFNIGNYDFKITNGLQLDGFEEKIKPAQKTTVYRGDLVWFLGNGKDYIYYFKPFIHHDTFAATKPTYEMNFKNQLVMYMFHIGQRNIVFFDGRRYGYLGYG